MLSLHVIKEEAAYVKAMLGKSIIEYAAFRSCARNLVSWLGSLVWCKKWS